MKVLVTGGAGFIGSHLVDALVDAGHEVFVIDHQRQDRRRFFHPAVRYYRMSISDGAVEKIFEEERPEAVCHLAAQISVTRSVADPLQDAERNIFDALKLLQRAKAAGCQHVVFASSGGAIYGDHPERPTPELFDTKPISPYGVSKQAFEHYLHATPDVRTVVLRMSNVYGPRQAAKGEASVIAIFIDRILQGEPVQIFGDGSSSRDYLYVGDAVQAFLAALEGEQSGTFNISSGVETNLNELWDTLCSVHGEDHPLQYKEERLGEVRRSVLDAAAARQELNWQPATSLQEGLGETYHWFKESYEAGDNA